jgi:uncharacterized protein (TIGR03435 family)
MRRPSNNDQRFRRFITRGFAPFLSVSQEHVETACDRVLERLQAEPERVPENAGRDSDVGRTARRGFRPAFALSAMAAAVLLMVFLQMSRSDIHAVVENADGGLYKVDGGRAIRVGEGIEANETVRTDGGLGAALKLTDGSTVEMRSKSELTLEDAPDGVRIRLGSGGVIVNAAKQRAGHLYVQTKHMTVAVIGTVFFVNAEEEGSRVAVIEGEVRVKQGTSEQKLLPGEQVATSPKMGPVPVKEGIAWSRQAEAHMALLEQARPQLSPEVQTKPQSAPTGKQAFEEATVRLSQGTSLESTGRGSPGMVFRGCTPATPQSPARIQIDPSRFAGTMNLYSWIIFAYSDYDCLRVYEFAEDLLPFDPPWLRSVGVQIQAVFPDGSLAGKEAAEGKPAKLKEMLQALLEDRFKLVVRRAPRELQVFAMKVAEAGPKLTPAREGDLLHCGQSGVCSVAGGVRGDVRPSWFQGSNASAADIASYLTSKFFRLVVDRTGLTGEFTFKTEYVPREGDPGIDGRNFQRFRDAGVTGPNLIEAIEKQLGLKLESTKAPVDVLVIDRVERPTEN